jgi:hypothetical protein
MGRSLSTYLVFGVNIGDDDDGWNFDGYPDVHEALGLDEEETEGEWLETALLVFLGHENVIDMDYGATQDALNACPLSVIHGGYEHGRLLLGVRSSTVKGLWSVQKIDLPESPSEEDAALLVAFLTWLESKGLVLEEEFRNPGWILAASYG